MSQEFSACLGFHTWCRLCLSGSQHPSHSYPSGDPPRSLYGKSTSSHLWRVDGKELCGGIQPRQIWMADENIAHQEAGPQGIRMRSERNQHKIHCLHKAKMKNIGKHWKTKTWSDNTQEEHSNHFQFTSYCHSAWNRGRNKPSSCPNSSQDRKEVPQCLQVSRYLGWLQPPKHLKSPQSKFTTLRKWPSNPQIHKTCASEDMVRS